MDLSTKILSDITVHMKYAKFNPNLNRRETWYELVTRNKEMHQRKYPAIIDEIEEAYKYVYDKKVLPSMRSLQFGGKPIEISPNRIYNCFGRETDFITDKGLKSFNDFNDGDEVTVLTHTGAFKKGIVKNYGNQQLNEITFKRGKSTKVIRATGNHRWLLFNGTETTDLKINEPLFPTQKNKSFDYDSATPIERLYWCYGYVFGDGTVLKKNGEPKYSMVRLCGEDSLKFLYRFKEMGFESSESNSLEGDIMVYTGKYLKNAPSIEVDGLDMIKAFMDGYLSADAYKNPDWYENNTLSKYKQIQSSDNEHQIFLEKYLDVCGYYITNKDDLTGQITNYGERPETYKYSITNHIGSRPNTSWSASEIKNTYMMESVWCLEVEDDKSFVLGGGIVTGNCAYLPIDDWRAFSETMFLLLGGTGVGFSVQRHHVEQLPEIRKPNPTRSRRFLIGDSIEGWADAIKNLMRSYFEGLSTPDFDYSDIRQKGAALITSGGKAPGPQPLKDCIHNIKKILDRKEDGSRLEPIEVHDIICFIADAVLTGGIRRAALISLFSLDDEEMLSAKSGAWWELNPQRGRANNSAVILRHKINQEEFMQLWKKIEDSNAGEPGVYFSNDKDWGTNPCCEIGLRPYQFCNLCEVNVSDIESQEDLEARSKAASFIGTLQAGYTNFHYLRDVWKRTTEKDALIGVGMTGIGSGEVLKYDLVAAAKVVKQENARAAKLIGINKAARTTTVKPSGTSSLVLGTASGIHAWHNDYYIRRIRVGKNEAIYSYLSIFHPEVVEDEYFKPKEQAVISLPVKAPEGSIFRFESPMQLLDRVSLFNTEWVKTGHRDGQNTHNVSVTVSIKKEVEKVSKIDENGAVITDSNNNPILEDRKDEKGHLIYKINEWPAVGKWMWENRESFNGISVLPYDGGSYIQAPFTDCTKKEYEDMMEILSDIDLTKVVEMVDNTNLSGEVACGASGCEVISA
jgi:ribonucleoside-diphosphate reductase alpha chain